LDFSPNSTLYLLKTIRDIKHHGFIELMKY
jgi:hypothetical protein